MTTRAWFRWLQRGLLVIGLLLVGLWSLDSLQSARYQAAESGKLMDAVHEAEVRSADAAVSPVIDVGPPVAVAASAPGRRGVLGRLEIPRLGVSAIVAEGVDMKTLGRAVGHIPSTALPGNSGNCALAGHRDTFLRGLRGVREDDVVQVVTVGRTYTYRVEWTRVVEPRRVDVLDSTATRSLTLITCYPFTYVGHAPRRFVVRARQVATAATPLVRTADIDPGSGPGSD